MLWRYHFHQHQDPLCLCNIPSSWTILNNTLHHIPLMFPSSFSLTCHIAADVYCWWHRATIISNFPRYLSLQNMACKRRNSLASQKYILKINRNLRMTNTDYLNWKRERDRERTLLIKYASQTLYESHQIQLQMKPTTSHFLILHHLFRSHYSRRGPRPTPITFSVHFNFPRSHTFGTTPCAGDQLVERPLPVHKHR